METERPLQFLANGERSRFIFEALARRDWERIRDGAGEEFMLLRFDEDLLSLFDRLGPAAGGWWYPREGDVLLCNVPAMTEDTAFVQLVPAEVFQEGSYGIR
jgi:hypothetical protein